MKGRQIERTNRQKYGPDSRTSQLHNRPRPSAQLLPLIFARQ